jgi:wobble nucleotide-excising tRNase|tara:strand:- start:15392 stop:15814 length:423 start_codon:yes stop_codon:yes gene_type:complete
MDTGKNEVRASLTVSVGVARTIQMVRWLTTLEGKRLVNVVNEWNETFNPDQSDEELLKAFGKVREEMFEVAAMLGQYENMVSGFLSQSSDSPEAAAPDITVDQLKEKVEELEKFGGFIDKINDQEEEEEDVEQSAPPEQE